MANVSNKEKRYDFIVVGAGAAGSVLAAELSASGAQVLIIESGGPDDAPTIMNPSIWFYNVGGPFDYHSHCPLAAIEQSQIQYRSRPRTWWRYHHQCHGVDAGHAAGLRRVG